MGASCSRDAHEKGGMKSHWFFSLTTKSQCDDSSSAPPPPLPPPPSLDSNTKGDTSTTAAAPPPPPELQDDIAQAAASVSAFGNPGPFELCTGDYKRLLYLDTHVGFRCDINKTLSPTFGAMHSFLLGTALPDGRTRTYAFAAQVSRAENQLFVLRVDPEMGSVDTRVHHSFSPNVTGKIQMHATAEGSDDQLLAEMDFGADTWTANLKYGSVAGGPFYGCNYLQTITPRLAMGGEGVYVAANDRLVSTYLLRYKLPKRQQQQQQQESSPSKHITAAATEPTPTSDSTLWANFNAGSAELTLGYKKNVTPNRVELAGELVCNPLALTSSVLLGAEFNLTRSKVAVCVDGNGKIQTTLQASLGMGPGSPNLLFSAEVDHMQDKMGFGYGITINS